MLFTKRGITARNDVPLKQCVTRHEARLKSELIKIKVKRGVTSNEDLVSQKVKDAGKTSCRVRKIKNSFCIDIFVISTYSQIRSYQ